MQLQPIETVEDLYDYLYTAIQLEHATIPPYLTALYSIHPGTNMDAYNLIKVVAVEEMLHLTLSANILNAIGGSPNLVSPGFVADYPTYLPDGEDDFQVSLEKFSEEAIDTFLNIERPAKVDDKTSNAPKLIKAQRPKRSILPSFKTLDGIELHFYSIGEFYKAIGDGLEKLCKEFGEEAIFFGEHAKQITSEYYYSGGGEIIPVYGLEDALAAITLISEQGEGYEGGIFDNEGELSHYYRFQQIKLGRYYHKDDEPEAPSGEELSIDWNAVYPIKTNVKTEDYPNDSDVYKKAIEFNTFYKQFLNQLMEAFNGQPEILMPAVGVMFRIKEMSYQLMRNPIPGNENENAAPTFQIDQV